MTTLGGGGDATTTGAGGGGNGLHTRTPLIVFVRKPPLISVRGGVLPVGSSDKAGAPRRHKMPMIESRMEIPVESGKTLPIIP